MKIIRRGSMAAALVVASACGDSRGVLQPTTPSLGRDRSPELSTSAAHPTETSGHFDAIVDFSTVTLTPKGGNCLLQISGRLVFSGTIEGTATGRTSALEFAPCEEVAVNPPGTFEDVFKSVAVFDGTVNGQPAHSDLLYMGRVQVGGAIDGRLVFSNGVAGVLDVHAIVAVGGDYQGLVVVK